jgi:sodium/bile acid cotransporter 7
MTEEGTTPATATPTPEGPDKLAEDCEAPIPSLIDNLTTEEELQDRPTMDEDDEKKDSCLKKFAKGLCAFYWKNEFLILIVLAILLARAYPPLGAIYLAPKITATWVAVIFIFLLAGLGLKTEEFSKAFQRVYFNLFVFVFSFGVDSSIVFGISRLLVTYNVINLDLANGMAIAACLPLTINMCVVLTQQSGGDEASAIFNSAFGNLVGVFLSPALILGYIGVKGEVSVATVFYKLAVRVLLPIIVGQLLKFFCPPVNDFVKKYKPYFKKGQMYALVFIVYTVFCRTFQNDENVIPIKDIFIMIVFVAISLAILMVLAWYALRLFFKNEIKLRVMGLYGCTHKTVAMGIPLINAIYDGNPAIAFYTLPLLIWHPMQLVVGTFLAPRLLAWVETEASEVEKDEEDKAVEDAPVKEVSDKKSKEDDVDAPSDELACGESVELEV